MSDAVRYRWEQVYPYALASLCLGGYWWAVKSAGPMVAAGARDTIGYVVGIEGTLVGFLATIGALFFALPDRPFIIRAAEMGALRKLLSYIKHAIIYCVLALIGGVALSTLETTAVPGGANSLSLPGIADHLCWMTALWVTLVALSLFSFLRVVTLGGFLLSKTLEAYERGVD